MILFKGEWGEDEHKIRNGPNLPLCLSRPIRGFLHHLERRVIEIKFSEYVFIAVDFHRPFQLNHKRTRSEPPNHYQPRDPCTFARVCNSVIASSESVKRRSFSTDQ